jgi:small-conductance mechanosensitive channel
VKFLKSFATALLASGGIVAVVIGLASQEAAGNLINGAMIMAYKPYKIGDFIVVTGHNVRGTVIDISLRHSVIETLEKTQMIVPNDIMNKAIIENISQIEHVKANYLYIDISYESDIDQAIKVIQDLVVKHPLFIDGRKDKKDPLVPVIVSDLKDSSIQLRATITSEDNVQGFQMLADIRKDLVTEFKKEGIEIPYPHMHIVK